MLRASLMESTTAPGWSECEDCVRSISVDYTAVASIDSTALGRQSLLSMIKVQQTGLIIVLAASCLEQYQRQSRLKTLRVALSLRVLAFDRVFVRRHKL